MNEDIQRLFNSQPHEKEILRYAHLLKIIRLNCFPKINFIIRTKDGDERPTAKWEHTFDISAVNYVFDVVAVGPRVEDLPEPPPSPKS